MPCYDARDDESGYRGHVFLFEMLEGLCKILPPEKVDALKMRKAWWNKGDPKNNYPKHYNEAEGDHNFYTRDKMANMLCNLCRNIKIPERPAILVQVKGLREWWDEHQRRDREYARIRRKYKKIKTSAQKKLAAAGLTDAEKSALGIK